MKDNCVDETLERFIHVKDRAERLQESKSRRDDVLKDQDSKHKDYARKQLEKVLQKRLEEEMKVKKQKDRAERMIIRAREQVLGPSAQKRTRSDSKGKRPASQIDES